MLRFQDAQHEDNEKKKQLNSGNLASASEQPPAARFGILDEKTRDAIKSVLKEQKESIEQFLDLKIEIEPDKNGQGNIVKVESKQGDFAQETDSDVGQLNQQLLSRDEKKLVKEKLSNLPEVKKVLQILDPYLKFCLFK
jgi:hypothetical protein